MTDDQDVDETVKRFVEDHVRTVESGSVHLVQFWEYYGPRAGGVPQERFKWHLIQALPDSIDREVNWFYGVELVPFNE